MFSQHVLAEHHASGPQLPPAAVLEILVDLEWGREHTIEVYLCHPGRLDGRWGDKVQLVSTEDIVFFVV